MIGAGGVITGLAALKRQDSVRSSQQHHHPQAPPPGAGPGSAHNSRKRKPRSDVVVVRGKLRLYSAAGFFLVLGVLVLMAGVAMAVLGYWPHNRPLPDGGPAPGPAPRVKAAPDGSSVTSGDPRVTPDPEPRVGGGGGGGGVLARFLERHLHSERMRMLGPFTMGIGIFVFICANAILHENRDRETKVIHMRDMYSTVIDLHSLHLQEHKHLNGAFSGGLGGPPQRPGPLYPGPSCYGDQDPAASASRLAAHTLLTFAGLGGAEGRSRCGSLRAISVEEEEEEEEEEGLLGEAKGGCGLLSPGYRDRSGAGSVFGFRPVGARQWEEPKARCQTRSIVSSSISAFTLPVIKLNNCVIDASDMDDITAEGEGPAAAAVAAPERSWLFPAATTPLSLAVPGPPAPPPPKAHKPPGLALLRSNSASETHSSSSFSSSFSSPSSGRYLSPGAAAAARKDFGSNGSLHMLSAHSKSLDLERGGVAGGDGSSLTVVSAEQRKHPSWPRLDRSGSKGYMRLEDREDPPVDRLLLLAPPPAPPVTGRRDYTKREKLLMISRSHNNLSFERGRDDDVVVAGGNLKRGTSETRF